MQTLMVLLSNRFWYEVIIKSNTTEPQKHINGAKQSAFQLSIYGKGKSTRSHTVRGMLFCSAAAAAGAIGKYQSQILESLSVLHLVLSNAFFFFFNLPASYFFFFPPLGFAFFLWLWQENLSAVFQYTQAGLVLGRRVSLPICNHRFMAFTRGVNADQMENTPARALQLLVLPHIRSQSLILIIRPKGNSVCSPNASQLSRWSGISFLWFPS